MENGQGTGSKLGLPPLTPEQQEALQRVGNPEIQHLPKCTLSAHVIIGVYVHSDALKLMSYSWHSAVSRFIYIFNIVCVCVCVYEKLGFHDAGK